MVGSMPWGYAGRAAELLGILVVLRLVLSGLPPAPAVAGLELNTLLAALAAAPIAAWSSDE